MHVEPQFIPPIAKRIPFSTVTRISSLQVGMGDLNSQESDEGE
jgi:hypothetical protein